MTTSPDTEAPRTGFDTAAAITRSLLGWGVVAGPFYVTVGIVLAATRPGFDFTRHPLSVLMLGDGGWMQRANLVLSAVMVLAAAYGMLRTVRNGRGLAMAALSGVYGVCMVLSAVFAPDPVPGFPAGSENGTVSISGVLHLLFGATGFIALAGAAFTYARWCSSRGDTSRGRRAAGCGAVLLTGFLGGAALAQSVAGVALLWLAVFAGWLWLATGSAHMYTVVPHPVLALRADRTD